MFNLLKNTAAASYQNVSAPEFKKLQEDKNTVLIDVRTAGEAAAGKISGAKNIDIMRADFEKQLQSQDKSKTYLLYCRSGSRSAQAASTMAKMGFEKVYNLLGGISAWPYGLTR